MQDASRENKTDNNNNNSHHDKVDSRLGANNCALTEGTHGMVDAHETRIIQDCWSVTRVTCISFGLQEKGLQLLDEEGEEVGRNRYIKI